jgi:hypothetical protein
MTIDRFDYGKLRGNEKTEKGKFITSKDGWMRGGMRRHRRRADDDSVKIADWRRWWLGRF